MDTEVSYFTTSNGLTVAYCGRAESPNVSMSLMVIAGSMYESSDEVGVAHFLEHIVFDGTEKYPSDKELAALIDERGGIRGAITSKEFIEYTAKVLKEDSEVAFEYLAEIVTHPLVRENDVQKQKKIIEQEIYRFKSDPEKLSQRLIYSVLFPNTRVGDLNTGDVEDIKKISQPKVLSYHKRTHCAKNMVLSVCGNLSEEHVKALVEKYFGNMESGEKIATIDILPISAPDPKNIIVPNSRQAVVSIGYHSFKTDDLKRYAADLLLALLTRGKTSRLYYEIREKRALAYMVSGSNFNGRNMGNLILQIGLAPDKISECLDVINNELKAIASIAIPQTELNKALAFIKAGIDFSFENSLVEASYYSRMWCSTGLIRSVKQELAQYESIAKIPDFIKKTAAEVFTPNPAILVIGPSDTIAKSLDKQ